MNADGTMDPKVLLSKTSPQPPPNVLSMKDALKLTTSLRESAESQSEPKNDDDAAPPRICGRCGKTGHIATEVGDDGLYKCPTRLAESLLPDAELNFRRAQASAEIEAINNSLSQSTSTTPSHSPIATSSLPADSFNRNWRLPSLIPPREWYQPRPPRRREHYIELLERQNLQLSIWKANYFELYMAIQRGSGSEKYPYQAGRERMVKLHWANLRLMRDAKAKSRAQLENMLKDTPK